MVSALIYGAFRCLSMETDRIVFIRYIDALTDPCAVLKRCADAFGITETDVGADSVKLRGRVPNSNPFTDAKRKYYVCKEYLADYIPEELRLVNSLLDDSLMEFLGYEFEEVGGV